MSDAAERVGVSPKQAKYATRFFIEVGLWTSTGRDIYAATPGGREFGALWETAPERARVSLGRLMQDLWFTNTLRRELSNDPVPVDGLLSALQSDAGAHDSHRTLLMFLLEWLTVARLVEHTEDGRVTRGQALVLSDLTTEAGNDAPAARMNEPFIPRQETSTVRSTDEASANTAAARDASPYALNLELRLTWEEMSSLDPDDLSRIIRVMTAVAKARRESAQHT